jgi:hypothetical protein
LTQQEEQTMNRTIAPTSPHALAIAARHAAIEAEIQALLKAPEPDSLTLLEMKRRKLQLKDRLAAAWANQEPLRA